MLCIAPLAPQDDGVCQRIEPSNCPSRPIPGRLLPPGAFGMDWIWYLFRFDGRINRALLWQALLLVMMLACMLGMIDQAIKVLNGAATFAFNFKVDFDFGVDDIFNVVDPRAYRQLATAD